VSSEVEVFCRRVLADSPAVAEIARSAEHGGGSRLEALGRAARLCRDQPEAAPADPPASPGAPPGEGERPGAALAEHVRAELQAAIVRLPERQREVLALREALQLSYPEIATVMGVDPAAVVPLLARARLRLRAARRGVPAVPVERCPDADRALRVLARLQDGEPLTAEDEDWLHLHLAECETCEMAHGAMLEAMANYRAWPE
jgi:RNA polymerase sigma-70 factor, ECF subfamily